VVGVADIEQPDTRPAGFRPGRLNEVLASRHEGVVVAPLEGIDNVVHGAEDQFRMAHGAVFLGNRLQGDPPRAFMEEYPVDVQQAELGIQFGNDMQLPQLVEKRARRHVAGLSDKRTIPSAARRVISASL